MDKLKELFDLCEASVTIIHNEHKEYYHTVVSFLNDKDLCRDGQDIEPVVRHGMIQSGNMITLTAYPDTPIGFYTVYHWDLESAVHQMLAIIKGAKLRSEGTR